MEVIEQKMDVEWSSQKKRRESLSSDTVEATRKKVRPRNGLLCTQRYNQVGLQLEDIEGRWKNIIK